MRQVPRGEAHGAPEALHDPRQRAEAHPGVRRAPAAPVALVGRRGAAEGGRRKGGPRSGVSRGGSDPGSPPPSWQGCQMSELKGLGATGLRPQWYGTPVVRPAPDRGGGPEFTASGGASGDVRVLGPGFPPDLRPRAPPLAPLVLLLPSGITPPTDRRRRRRRALPSPPPCGPPLAARPPRRTRARWTWPGRCCSGRGPGPPAQPRPAPPASPRRPRRWRRPTTRCCTSCSVRAVPPPRVALAFRHLSPRGRGPRHRVESAAGGRVVQPEGRSREAAFAFSSLSVLV